MEDDETLRRFDMRLTAVERDLAEGSKRFERLEKSHDENTRITVETKTEVGKLTRSVREVGEQISGPLELYDAARMGLRMIGRFGEACVWLGRRWWLVLAVGVAVKVWWLGGSWLDVWRAVTRALTGLER